MTAWRASPSGGLDGGLPAGVDLDQVEQRCRRRRRHRQLLGAGPGPGAVEGELQRLGAGLPA